MPFELTSEQKQIIEAVNQYSKIKINAFAGTGKTTTLRAITEAYRDRKFIYLAFNRAIKEEAQRKFASNTQVFTTHGFALHFLKRNPHLDVTRSKRVRSNYRTVEVADILGVDWETADKVNAAYTRYLQSSETDFRKFLDAYFGITELRQRLEELEKGKVKEEGPQDTVEEVRRILLDEEDEGQERKRKQKQKLTKELEKAEELAQLTAELSRIILQRGDIPHDTYLKWFHLHLPRLAKELQNVTILLDEAQDTNPVTLAITEELAALGNNVIVVGDAHQQIYAFRGAVNAMWKFEAEKTLYLTRSFRLSPSTAEKANLVLKLLKGEKKQLVGAGPAQLEGEAILTRTNAEAISQWMQLIEKGRRVKFVRHPDLIFSLPLSVYYFLRNEDDKIKERWILRFKDRDEIFEYAKGTEDKELLGALILAEKQNVERLYREALDSWNSDNNADIYISTAHSAKGLEWRKVTLAEDFPSLLSEVADMLGITEEEKILEKLKEPEVLKVLHSEIWRNRNISTQNEVNLFYVALTRGAEEVEDLSGNVKQLEELSKAVQKAKALQEKERQAQVISLSEAREKELHREKEKGESPRGVTTSGELFRQLWEKELKNFEELCSQFNLDSKELLEQSALFPSEKRGKFALVGQKVITNVGRKNKRKTKTFLKLSSREEADPLIRAWRRVKALRWYRENLEPCEQQEEQQEQEQEEQEQGVQLALEL